MNERVAIIGTTTWGTTLGIILARKSVPVCILARTPDEAKELTRIAKTGGSFLKYLSRRTQNSQRH